MVHLLPCGPNQPQSKFLPDTIFRKLFFVLMILKWCFELILRISDHMFWTWDYDFDMIVSGYCYDLDCGLDVVAFEI